MLTLACILAITGGCREKSRPALFGLKPQTGLESKLQSHNTPQSKSTEAIGDIRELLGLDFMKQFYHQEFPVLSFDYAAPVSGSDNLYCFRYSDGGFIVEYHCVFDNNQFSRYPEKVDIHIIGVDKYTTIRVAGNDGRGVNPTGEIIVLTKTYPLKEHSPIH